jgi:hypothetical protein
MTATETTRPSDSPVAALAGRTDRPPTAERSAPVRRATWALWGAAAGVLGFVATMASDAAGSLQETDYLLGADVIDELDRAGYHVGVVAGFACVVALLFTAAGWRRWASRRAGDSLAARALPLAFVASAGAMMIGYGLKGSMAVYLDGGIDQGTMTKEGLYSIFMILDLGSWMVWWGGAAAALITIWLSFRERLVPRWVGGVSVFFSLVFLGFILGTGLPGMAAVSTVWLTIVSVGLAASKRFGTQEHAVA